MREKVTDSWRWSENGVTKKSYATLLKSLAEELAAPAANIGRSIAIWAGRRQRSTASALSSDHQKGFAWGLAGKRIFHIGNAMKAKFSKVTVP